MINRANFTTASHKLILPGLFALVLSTPVWQCLAADATTSIVNSTVSPTLNQITPAEIQLSAQTVAQELNQLWWWRTGAYTTLTAGAAWWYYDHTQRVAAFKAQQAQQAAGRLGDVPLAATTAGVQALEQKIGQLVLAEQELLEAKIKAELLAKQSAITKAKQIGILSLVTGGFNLLLQGAGTELVQQVLRPGVKLMGPHNLNYYLYRTALLEQLAHLHSFVKYTAGAAAQTTSADQAVLSHDLAQLRQSMVAVLGYLSLEQARLDAAALAPGATSNAVIAAQRLQSLGAAIQRDVNDLLTQFQLQLTATKLAVNYQQLSQTVSQTYVSLRQQLELCHQVL